MGFEVGGGSRGSTASSAYKTWSLTQNGQMRVDAIAGKGLEGRILEAIRSQSSATVSEIVRETGLPPQTIKIQLEILQKRGYVSTIN